MDKRATTNFSLSEINFHIYTDVQASATINPFTIVMTYMINGNEQITCNVKITNKYDNCVATF